MLPATIRTRTIAESDLKFIHATVNEHWDNGSNYIFSILCKKQNQHIGRPHDMTCREDLLNLNQGSASPMTNIVPIMR